jgi:hypothetical protein
LRGAREGAVEGIGDGEKGGCGGKRGGTLAEFLKNGNCDTENQMKKLTAKSAGRFRAEIHDLRA